MCLGNTMYYINVLNLRNGLMNEYDKTTIAFAIKIVFAVFISIMLIPHLIEIAEWTSTQPLYVLATVVSICMVVLIFGMRKVLR